MPQPKAGRLTDGFHPETAKDSQHGVGRLLPRTLRGPRPTDIYPIQRRADGLTVPSLAQLKAR